jgi:hypothetical protein
MAGKHSAKNADAPTAVGPAPYTPQIDVGPPPSGDGPERYNES